MVLDCGWNRVSPSKAYNLYVYTLCTVVLDVEVDLLCDRC